MTKEKIYYTMSEVAEMFGVNQPLIRYWESEFSILRPARNNKGNRLFKQKDIDTFGLIYHLLKEKHMTLEGAKLYLKKRSLDEIGKDSLVVEKLENIKLMLCEVLDNIDNNNNSRDKVVFSNDNEE